MTAEEALSRLLCDLFGESSALRRFFRHGDDELRIYHALPGENAPLVEVAAAAIDQLKNRGLVHRLLDRLAREFRERRGDIQRAAELWSYRLPEAPEHDVGPEPTSRRGSTDALAKLQNATRSALADLSVLLESDATDPVLLRDVYVERSIEQTLIDALARADADTRAASVQAPLLIVGDAGVGKTSLLWRLSSRLRREYEPWFVKASTLRELTAEQLAEAIQRARGLGRRPLLLLDTVDLLLHDSHDSRHLTDILQVAADHHCASVVTCRRGEVRSLPKEFRGATHILGDYDEEELRRAYLAHVKRFQRYANAVDLSDPLAYLAALDDAQRALMVHPLTLRMVFALYRPGHIPPKIDVARLYADFWANRVAADRRVGVGQDSRGADLAETVCELALHMLADGAIFLTDARARNILAERERTGLDVLIDRGIIRRTSDGMIEFFHQSFFEYAAARGVLDSFSDEGLGLLRERVLARTAEDSELASDLLTVGVLEQALLLAADCAELATRAAADEVFAALWDCKHSTLVSAALSVYARLPAVDPNLRRRASVALRSPEAASRFLECIPLASRPRARDLFAHVADIWAQATGEEKDWSHCEQILFELARLAVRGGESVGLVREFLDRQQVVATVVAAREKLNSGRTLLVVLEALAPHDSTCWRDLIAVAQISSAALPDVLGVMARQAEHLGQPYIAHAALAALPSPGSKTDASVVWGELWAAEWRIRGLPIEQILAEVVHEADLQRFKHRLNGLAVALRELSEVDGAAAWQAFEAERDRERRALWVRITWTETLARSGADDGVGRASVRFVATRFVEVLAHDAPTPAWAREPFLAGAATAGFPPLLAGALLADARTDRAERWLRLEDLGPLLPYACLHGHPAALAAFERLLGAPAEFRKLGARVISRLDDITKRRPDDTSATALLFRLALAHGHMGAPGRVLLERAANLSPELLRMAAPLGRLVDEVTRRSAHDEQRDGARLWYGMVRNGLRPPLDGAAVARVEKLLRKNLQWWAQLLGEAAPGEAAKAAIAALDQVTGADLEDLEAKKAVLGSLIRLIRTEGVADKWAFTVLERATRAPTDSRLLAEVGWLLGDLVPHHMDAALGFLRVLVEQQASLGKSGLSNVRSRLRKPVRAYFAAASSAQREAALELVHQVADHFSLMLIDGACREAAAETLPMLRRLLIDPRVSERVKWSIEAQLKLISSPERGRRWPALASRLARRRKPRGGRD